MIYARLALMRDLLAEDVSIYVHCDWRVSPFIRLTLDEIFGQYLAEIAWKKLRSPKSQSAHFSNIKDSIFIYSKTRDLLFMPQYVEKDPALLSRVHL